MPPTHQPRRDNELDVPRLIAEQLAGLRYGMLQLTVHDGRVVQIDRIERTRVQDQPPTSGRRHGD